jgi:hypothetical protein
MKVFLTGGSGFVGRTLAEQILGQGHDVTVLTRSAESAGFLPEAVTLVEGDPTRPGDWQAKAARQDVIINLAGSSIFRRWTRDAKKNIRESRVLTTRNLVEALSGSQGEGTVLLSTSAVGYYGFHGDEKLREDSGPGDDFLAGVAREWEEAALEAQQFGTRVCCCRFGIVFGRNGGALGQMLPMFRKGLGSPLGSGNQWISWIHEQDLVRIYLFLMDRPEVSGPLNCTAPNPVTNREMTQELADVLGKPTFMPSVPGFMVKMKMGEFGSVLLEGQRVLPARLLDLGFEFQFPTMREALTDLLTKP